MSISTVGFIILIISTALTYFVLPKNVRWIALLAASCLFYAAADYRCFIFIGATALTVFFAAKRQQKLNALRDGELAAAEDKEEKKALRAKYKTKKRKELALCLLFNFAILAVMKYSGVITAAMPASTPPPPPPPFLADHTGLKLLLPLGVSFYTFQAAGYLIDIYNGKAQAEKNFAKFALFVSFFPQIVQGPISRFDQLAPQLYEGHDYDFDRLKYGLELVLWGYLKKLVVADMLFPFIWDVVTHWQKCSGTAILVSMLFYSIQLYADFSGGIDISRGVCQVLGIDLTPNFRQPYFSKSIAEFWRRWHITLGNWFKDYVFYPLATSKAYLAAGKRLRKRFTRKTADRICTSVVSLITFVLIGVWHGASLGYVLYGAWHGVIIAVSTLLADFFPKVLERLHIKAESWYWKLFQMLRTYILVLAGFYLVLPPKITDAFGMIAKTFTGPTSTFHQLGDVFAKYHFYREFPITMIGAGLMLLISLLTAFGRDVRQDLNKAPLPVQWIVLMAGVLFVVTFGCYGPGYDATSFIYQVF